jgi:MSHA biogenesis protein MshO
MRRETGYTLIEVVVVVAITALVAGFIGSFITRPMQVYNDVALRGELVASASSALERVAREVRAALPNSVRVAAGGTALELLHVADGARYRSAAGGAHTAASDLLDLAGDASFNVLGRFQDLAFSYGSPLPAGHRLSVYATGSGVWSDAASGTDPGVITPATTGLSIADDGDEDQLVLSAPFRFALASPQQRVYVVEGPLSFLCSASAGTLMRYAGYAVAAGQPVDPSAAPLSSAGAALLVDRVAGCSFDYTPGTPQRAALVTIELTLAHQGEQVRLLEQVHVMNTP